jgi:hypothetical protein
MRKRRNREIEGRTGKKDGVVICFRQKIEEVSIYSAVFGPENIFMSNLYTETTRVSL